MGAILSKRQADDLCSLVTRYKDRTTFANPKKVWKDDSLWLQTVSEVVVVGKASPGDVLRNSVEAKESLSWTRLKSYRSDSALRQHIHKVLRIIGARWVGKDLKKDKKSKALVKNFRMFREAGGPKQYFAKLAGVSSEKEKIDRLMNGDSKLAYFQKKLARDLLIELSLAKNCLALDSRIIGILKKLGADVPEHLEKHLDQYYEQIEAELLKKIAKRCNLKGTQLDRVLFQNYDLISADLRIKAMR